MRNNQRPAETENISPKIMTTGRKQRRVLAHSHHVRSFTGRSPRRTGQPEWFAQMQWDRQRKAFLRKLPVSELVGHGICTDKQAAALTESGYKTVWDVTDAKYTHLLKVSGFGPKTVAKLWQDLKIKGQIEPNWKPADGR